MNTLSVADINLKSRSIVFLIGEGNGNQFQYFYLENPIAKGTWQATVHGVAELDTTEETEYTAHFFYKYNS